MNKPPKKKPFKKTGINVIFPFEETQPVKDEATKNKRSFAAECRVLVIEGLEHRKAV